MIEEAKTRLEAAGIVIPFPQRDVHFYNHSKEMEIRTCTPEQLFELRKQAAGTNPQ